MDFCVICGVRPAVTTNKRCEWCASSLRAEVWTIVRRNTLRSRGFIRGNTTSGVVPSEPPVEPE